MSPEISRNLRKSRDRSRGVGGDREVNVEEARYLAARIPGATLVELRGDDHLIYAGDIDPLIDEVQRFVGEVGARRSPEGA